MTALWPISRPSGTGGLLEITNGCFVEAKHENAVAEPRTASEKQEFACSMLVARRLFPQAPNHKLGVLVEYANLPVTGRYHRALADAEMAASLLVHMEEELRRRYQLCDVPHELLRKIQKVQKNQLDKCVAGYRLKSPATQ